MKNQPACVIALLVVLCTIAHAQPKAKSEFRTGSGFVQQCEPFRQWSQVRAQPLQFNQCAVYTLGVVDTFRIYATYDEDTEPFCMSKSVTTYQLLLTVLDYMQEQQEDLEVETALLIMSAIRDHYPCDH